MVKKRSSLQFIFAPSFLRPSSPSTTTTSRMRSSSSSSGSDFPYASGVLDISHFATLPRRNSPPPDLIDDDPFANLSSPRPSTITAPAPQSPSRPSYHTPRSPLSPDKDAIVPSSPTLAPSALTISSGRVHALPAHRKPAFKPRPSLPSLHTLAQMNLFLPRKVRKGTVGAGLPFEPWDDQCEPVASGSSCPAQTLDSLEERASNSELIVGEYLTTSPISVNSMLSQIPDFNSDADFMDLYDDDGDQHEFFTAPPEDEDIDVGSITLMVVI
ncbi:hypothetical protein BDZ89DRAFT_46313 [Hymenopellis radicata]|nr:hypothetical protein BDZ89DRAFT_46313 [Hymenopellis radicata]